MTTIDLHFPLLQCKHKAKYFEVEKVISNTHTHTRRTCETIVFYLCHFTQCVCVVHSVRCYYCWLSFSLCSYTSTVKTNSSCKVITLIVGLVVTLVDAINARTWDIHLATQKANILCVCCAVMCNACFAKRSGWFMCGECAKTVRHCQP